MGEGWTDKVGEWVGELGKGIHGRDVLGLRKVDEVMATVAQRIACPEWVVKACSEAILYAYG